MSAADPAFRATGRIPAGLADAALICVGAAALMLPSLLLGPPTGHDYPHHLAWIQAFSSAQEFGRPYPRWLETLWFGAGGADFFFYPPLAYFGASLIRAFACPGCTPDTLMLATGVLGLAVSGLGLRALANRFVGRWPALAGALVYMALPYHLGADWFERMALAEFTALAVLPWLVAAFADCLAGRRRGIALAVLSGALALAHLHTAVIATFALVVLAFILPRAPGWRPFAACLGAGAIGLGLAAVYWYPAIALFGSVRTDLFGEHAFILQNFLLAPNAGSAPFIARLEADFVPMSLAALAISAIAPASLRVPTLAIAALLVLTLCMVTPVSLPLWEATPLSRVQLPWRFLMLADLAFALAAAVAAETLGRRDPSRWRRGTVGAALAAMAAIIAAGYPSLDGRGRSALPHPTPAESLGAFEWLPRESADGPAFADYAAWRYVLADAMVAGVRPEVRLTGPGEARVLASGPRRLEFEVDLPGPARAVFHRTYWRFWRIENRDTGAAVALEPTDRFPLASAVLPAGRARYRLELPTLPEERIGALASAVSLALLLVWAGVSRRRRR